MLLKLGAPVGHLASFRKEEETENMRRDRDEDDKQQQQQQPQPSSYKDKFPNILPGRAPTVKLSAGVLGRLLQAAEKNDAAAVLQQLESGASANTVTSSGKCALHFAVEHNNAEMVEMLVAAGARPDFVWQEPGSIVGYSVYRLSVKKKNDEILRMLCSVPNCNVDAKSARDSSALQSAVLTGNHTAVTMLCATGARNVTPDFLVEAVKEDDRERVKMVLALQDGLDGAKIMVQYASGTTALHAAVLLPTTAMLELLLEHAKKQKLLDASNPKQSLLAFACINSRAKAARLLIGAGALLSKVEGVNGESPLILAASCGDVEMVKFLLELGCDEKEKWGGKDAAGWARAEGHQEAANVLREAKLKKSM